MDDISRLEISTRRYYSLACGQAPLPGYNLPAFLQDSWTSSAVNGAIHTAAAHEA
jgi:hypothetical protein